ncbi:MAG: hypothetical protein Q9160_007662 [Pyrenula sp. 1 TL-2023]
MPSNPPPSNEKRPEQVQDLSVSDLNATELKKRSSEGIVLVPQPSDDPADPLNWPIWKKILILAVVSLAGFIGLAQALANQAGFFLQAELYHKTPVEISYSVVQFWWTIGVEAAVIVLVFLFLKETQYDRRSVAIAKHRSWIRDRFATFFPGHRILPPKSGRQLNSAASSFFIMVCPVTILAGSFLCLTFGWAVAVNTLLSIFLQTPSEAGGYGFTPTQNALFTFGQWVGIGTAFCFDGIFNDRVPLWACRRFGRGVWKPEYRLFPLLVPLVLFPIGLGLFGASLQYRLHFMVLALADTIIIFCEHVLAPVIINYVVEGFTHHAAEVTAALNFYRLILGTVVPFFINQWEAAVGGAGWVFGMMAFFSLLGFAAVGVLAWNGPAIRRLSFASLRASEEGVDLDIKDR